MTGALGGLRSGLRALAGRARGGAPRAGQPPRSLRRTLKTIEQLQKAGASVKLFSADVTREERVEEVLAEIKRTMPPLRGIVHAAGVLDDGMVHKQTWERFSAYAAPR